MERLTYSPIVNGILESEGKIAGWPRTPAKAPRFQKKIGRRKNMFLKSVLPKMKKINFYIRKPFRL